MIVRATVKFNGASIAIAIGNLSMPEKCGYDVSVRPPATPVRTDWQGGTNLT